MGSIGIAGAHIDAGDIVHGGTHVGDIGDIVTERPHRDDIVREEGRTDIERPGTDIRHERITDNEHIRRAENISRPGIEREISRDMPVEGPAMRTSASTYIPETAKPGMEAISKMKIAVAKNPKYSMMSMQPHGAIVSASLSTKFDGYQRNYDLL